MVLVLTTSGSTSIEKKGPFFLYEYIMPSSNTKGKFVNTNYINFELFSLFIATILKMY